MSVPSFPLPATEEVSITTSDTPLSGRRLLAGRSAWGILVVLTLTVFFASLPEYLAQLQTPCTAVVCEYQQLTSGQAETLNGIGISPGDYAAYTAALTIAVMGVCLAISALLIWRRSEDRMALCVALLLATFGPIVANNSVSTTPTFWQVPRQGMGFVGAGLLVLVFLLFPSGRFVPRWTRWTLVVYLVIQVPLTFFPNTPLLPSNPESQIGWLVALGELGTVVLVQFYRYWRVSNFLQRQQTKWVILGLAAPITVLAIGTALVVLFPQLAEPGSLYMFALNEAGFPLLLCIPLSFGIAILRYRLWDIDTIINKALVYGLLTGLLGALYAGLIIGLTSLADVLSGGQASEQPIVLVISTLAIAALFTPARKRIQAIIDRRFYRRKYDAEKTLAAFSATLRQEVDLEQLRESLLAVVNETMQPAYVSLWLQPPDQQQAQPTRAADEEATTR